MVLGLALLTDYDGDGKRPISFPTHGKLDAVQAAMAMFMPTVLGFGDDRSALVFRAQALNECAVIALTDFQGAAKTSEVERAA